MKKWNESRCSSTDEWFSKCYSVHSMEYYSEIKEEWNIDTRSPWSESLGIMLSEKNASKLYDPFCIIFKKWQTWVLEEEFSDGGGAEDGRFVNKRARKSSS